MKTLASMEYDERGAGEVVCLVHTGVFGAWFAPLFERRPNRRTRPRPAGEAQRGAGRQLGSPRG